MSKWARERKNLASGFCIRHSTFLAILWYSYMWLVAELKNPLKRLLYTCHFIDWFNKHQVSHLSPFLDQKLGCQGSIRFCPYPNATHSLEGQQIWPRMRGVSQERGTKLRDRRSRMMNCQVSWAVPVLLVLSSTSPLWIRGLSTNRLQAIVS